MLHRFPSLFLCALSPLPRWCSYCRAAYALACTAGEAFDIFRERDGDDLERLGHGWIDVDQIDEGASRRPETQGHGCLVNHLSGVGAKHGDAHDATCSAVED